MVEEARAVRTLLHVVRPNIAAPKRVSGVDANDVYCKEIHRGGLVTHTPLRNNDDEMASRSHAPINVCRDKICRSRKSIRTLCANSIFCYTLRFAG